MPCALVLRSPHAHARILAIDAGKARAMPGVIAVLTADDLADVDELPCDWDPPGMDPVPKHPVLAHGRVRYAGQPIAVVAAEAAQAAEEALATIAVTYQPLPAVVDQESAMAEGAPCLHEAAASNIAFRFRRSSGNVARAFANADILIRRRFINSRVTAAPLEGRAVLSDFDGRSGRLTHHTSSQLPHIHARSLGKCLGLALHKLRLIAPDIGGGFGSKLGFYPEDVLCALLAMRTGRSCAWKESRGESFLATTHGRDQIQYAELAAGRDGKISALKTRIIADLGAYAFGMGPGVPAINTGLSVTGLYTNRTPTGPYRGAGHPEATFLIERMIDELARELARDPADIRRANFVAPSATLYRLPTGLSLDSGDFAAGMDAALTRAGYVGLRERQVQLRKEGQYLGIGLAVFAENSGVGPSMGMPAVGLRRAGHESARVVVHPDARATVFCGAQSTGQGHSTGFAQIAASVLGIAVEDIAVVEGDSQAIPFGTGTYNSRSTSIGGSAVYQAARKIIDKATKIAAHKLQRRPRDLVYENGRFRVVPRPGIRSAIARHGQKLEQRIVRIVVKRRAGLMLPAIKRGADALSFADIAREAHLGHDLPLGMVPGLDETCFFDPKDMLLDYGAQVAVVEVDPESGHIALLRLVMVDDCGRVINPLLAEGQVHGGAAQGIGQALMEAMVHGRGGEPLVGSFSDYAMPHATDMPAFETERTEIPTKLNPLGVRGVGEGATIGATPALVNAVLDALAPLGVTDLPMPITPMRVWKALKRARNGVAATNGSHRSLAGAGEAIPQP